MSATTIGSTSSSSTSSSSSSSSSILRMFLSELVDSFLQSFKPPVTSKKTQAAASRAAWQQEMNATLTVFEKTYVSFPELSDHDPAEPHCHRPAANTDSSFRPLTTC